MRIAAALALTGFVVAAVRTMPAEASLAQQQASCLHGARESAPEASRRKNALQFVRAINTAEAQAWAATGRYQPLATLSLPPTPNGFLLAFGESAAGYLFVLKDTNDPCRFALVSDQEGLIYTAQPIQ